MTAGALKRACHHVCKQPRSAPLNPQTWLYGVSSRMGGERRAGCQERAGAGVAQSGGCHIRGQQMDPGYAYSTPPCLPTASHSREVRAKAGTSSDSGGRPTSTSLPSVASRLR